MPQSIDASIERLIEGSGLETPESSLCDFSIAEQNAAAEAQGIQASAPSKFKPLIGENITYVVACVIVNNDNEVLMIQEAKESCAGKWYLPAGRMEKGESIVAATEREVLEETGLEVRLTSLLAVETAGGSWFRFVLTGDVIGGELKTPAKADKESLQAKWISDLKEITLRANDIVSLIERARNYKFRGGDRSWHCEILPVPPTHGANLLRLIIVVKKRSTNKVHILLSEKNALHFPTAEINPTKNIHSTLRKFMVDMFGSDVPQHKPHGLLSVEHAVTSSSQGDGVCLTLLVLFRPPLEEVPIIGKCSWHEVSEQNGVKLSRIVSSKNSLLVLNVVR